MKFKMMLMFCSLALFTVSCTRSSPTIDYTTMKVVYQMDGNAPVVGYNFFAVVRDEDGPEDLDELRLYNDNEGLMWTINSGNWTLIEESGRTWIGSRQLLSPDGEIVPSGQFRAVIVDKSGETGESIFGFDAPADSPYRFPTIKVQEGNYTITSAYPDNYILLYFNDGEYRSLQKINNKSGTVNSLQLPADAFSIALWADDSNKAVSALTGKVYIRE